MFGLALFLVLGTRVVILWPKAPFWYDECLTYYNCTGAGWSDFVNSVNTGINATPPVYFALLWLLHFPAGEWFALLLRLLSALELSVAGALLYSVLRKSCGSWPAGFGVAGVFGSSFGLLLSSGLDARFYGFFMLASVLTTWSTWRLVADAPRATLPYAVHAGCHALLAASCYTGVVFGIAGALALLGSDRLAGRRWNRAAVVSSALGWCVLLPFLPLLKRQIADNPTEWIERPRWSQLVRVIDPQSDFVILLAGLFVLIALLVFRRNPGFSSASRTSDLPDEPTTGHPFLAILSVSFFAVPLAFWFSSHFQIGPNLSLQRYALPMISAWVIMLSLMLQRMALPYSAIRANAVFSGLCLAGLLLHAPFDAHFRHPPRPEMPWPLGTPVFRNPALADCPIAAVEPLTYLPRAFSGFAKNRLIFLRAEEEQVARWRQFSTFLNVSSADSFLGTHRRFLILKDRLEVKFGNGEWSSWLETRLQTESGWTITTLTSSGNSALLLVERLP